METNNSNLWSPISARFVRAFGSYVLGDEPLSYAVKVANETGVFSASYYVQSKLAEWQQVAASDASKAQRLLTRIQG